MGCNRQADLAVWLESLNDDEVERLHGALVETTCNPVVISPDEAASIDLSS